MMKEQDENISVSAIEQVYKDRIIAQLDSDVEVSILRSCGYKIPSDELKLAHLADRLLAFIDKLSEKDKNMIYSNAEAVAERMKKIKRFEVSNSIIDEFKQETPLEMIFSSSRIDYDLFLNWDAISLEDKLNLIEAIKIGFETQHNSLDGIEDYIINNYKI